MSENTRDVRLVATERIWKYGVAMLALSLVIVFFSRAVTLPLYVVLATALASASVCEPPLEKWTAGVLMKNAHRYEKAIQ